MCYQVARDFSDVDVKLDNNFRIDRVLTEFGPRKSVFPRENIPVIVPGSRILDVYRWGLIPFWAKDIKIGTKLGNARSETIDEKPSFKESFLKRRCLILASGFYEWDINKMPFYFEVKDQKIFAFAGLWDEWIDKKNNKIIKSSTIITTEPNDTVKTIHGRMPVILSPKDYETWLKGDDIKNLKDLLKPYEGELIKKQLEKKPKKIKALKDKTIF